MKLSVTALDSEQGTVNNGRLMSRPRSRFVSIRGQISTAARIIKSVPFVSEVAGLKMSAEIKKREGEKEKKDVAWGRQ